MGTTITSKLDHNISVSLSDWCSCSAIGDLSDDEDEEEEDEEETVPDGKY